MQGTEIILLKLIYVIDINAQKVCICIGGIDQF